MVCTRIYVAMKMHGIRIYYHTAMDSEGSCSTLDFRLDREGHDGDLHDLRGSRQS